MKSIFIALFVLLFGSVSTFGCCTLGHNISPKKIIRDNYSIQLRADVLDGDGSIYATGFAINENHILTVGHFCAPVVAGFRGYSFNENIKMSYVDMFGQVAEKDGLSVVAIDQYNDICLLEKWNHGIKVVTIVDDFFPEVSIGDEIAIAGGPAAYYPSVSYGHITSVEAQVGDISVPEEGVEISGKRRMILTVHTCSGNSGSPVILIDKGVVIGMVYAGPGRCAKISYAVTANQIKDFLEQNGQQYLGR